MFFSNRKAWDFDYSEFKDFNNNFDNDRLPEVAISQPNPDILVSVMEKLQNKFSFFSWPHNICWRTGKTAVLYRRMGIYYNVITKDYTIFTNVSTSGLGGHIAISGCPLLSQSFADTFLSSPWVVENLDFVTWFTIILILDPFSHISQHERKISPV